MNTPVHRLCLNMIVRDEAHVITECLDSVSAHIDYWVICDTGSEDATPQIVQDYFAARGIPGELHHHPWRDFGHNRSRALELVAGKATYAWVMDADDYLVGDPDLSSLTAGSYDLQYRLSDECHYWRRQLFRMDLPWRYRGAVHEYAECAEPATAARLDGDYHIAARSIGGARNRNPDKYARDVALLEQELEKSPGDPRSTFYLAQSLYDHGDMEKAQHWYRRRAGMGGWEEEVFYSLLRVALALEASGADFAVLRGAFLDAWERRPGRAEPLCHLARLCRVQKAWQQAYLFARRAADTPYPEDDLLFVDASVWAWRALDELSIAAYWTGRYRESEQCCRELLDGDRLPGTQRNRVEENLRFAEAALAR